MAQGTPFTVDPLNCLLQYNGIMPLGNQILKGKADLNALPIDDATWALLSNMHNKTKPYADCEHLLSYKELQNGNKKWAE